MVCLLLLKGSKGQGFRNRWIGEIEWNRKEGSERKSLFIFHIPEELEELSGK